MNTRNVKLRIDFVKLIQMADVLNVKIYITCIGDSAIQMHKVVWFKKISENVKNVSLDTNSNGELALSSLQSFHGTQ